MWAASGLPDLQYVMSGIDQCPFAADLVMAPQQELPEATSLLDLESRVSRTAFDLIASVNRRRGLWHSTSYFIILPHMGMSMKLGEAHTHPHPSLGRWACD